LGATGEWIMSDGLINRSIIPGTVGSNWTITPTQPVDHTQSSVMTQQLIVASSLPRSPETDIGLAMKYFETLRPAAEATVRDEEGLMKKIWRGRRQVSVYRGR
jgi:hypothetical protein